MKYKIGDRVSYDYADSQGTGIVVLLNSSGTNLWYRIREDLSHIEHDYFYTEVTLVVDGNDILKDMVNK